MMEALNPFPTRWVLDDVVIAWSAGSCPQTGGEGGQLLRLGPSCDDVRLVTRNC